MAMFQSIKCYFGSHPDDEEPLVVEQDMMEVDGQQEVRSEKKYCVNCGACWIRFRAIIFRLDTKTCGVESPATFSKWIRYGR